MNNRTHITPIGSEGMYILDTASWRTEKPIMNKDLCIECGLCLSYCPVNAIIYNDSNKYEITYDFCKGCGICAVECPKKAITMTAEGGGK
jgi:pyruvate ferredoxin oxidoreductase delta subunit